MVFETEICRRNTLRKLNVQMFNCRDIHSQNNVGPLRIKVVRMINLVGISIQPTG